jgi:hypothetical protein
MIPWLETYQCERPHRLGRCFRGRGSSCRVDGVSGAGIVNVRKKNVNEKCHVKRNAKRHHWQTAALNTHGVALLAERLL